MEPPTPPTPPPLSGHESRAARTDRETTYHPALSTSDARPLPAGKAIVVVAVALVVAALLNSGWMVRTGEGMPAGPGRTAVLALAAPIDAVATRLGLDRPRQGLETLLGREPLVGGEELEDGDDAILTRSAPAGIVPEPGASPVAGTNGGTVGVPAVRRPTTDRPIELLVMGDSLSTYVAEHLGDTLADGRLVDVTPVFRNGTGLATPRFFNWQAFARQQVEARKPEAVVMIIGGNDNQDMQRNGKRYNVGTPEWGTEYARRVAVVMKTMVDLGVQRVYWSGPPTASDGRVNREYAAVNAAVARAAGAVPGVRYVDLFHGTAVDGRYAEKVQVDGRTVVARQHDGIHWSWQGAVQPARLVLEAVQRDFGSLGVPG